MGDALTPRYFESLKFSVPLSGVGLSFDVCILILPLAAISQLQMSAGRKLAVSLMFMTGLRKVRSLAHISQENWS